MIDDTSPPDTDDPDAGEFDGEATVKGQLPDELRPKAAGEEPPSGSPGEETTAASPAGDDDLRERLEKLEKEKKETYERLLRTAADFDNFRKRQRKELDDNTLKARESVLKEMLPVIDNLERALQAAQTQQGAGTAGIIDGVKLVLRQFQTALERFEVKPVEAVGKAFDPMVHEAIQQMESADHPNGTVINELQRGYTIGPRLLRPAMVVVSRSAASADATADDTTSEATQESGSTD